MGWAGRGWEGDRARSLRMGWGTGHLRFITGRAGHLSSSSLITDRVGHRSSSLITDRARARVRARVRVHVRVLVLVRACACASAWS